MIDVLRVHLNVISKRNKQTNFSWKILGDTGLRYFGFRFDIFHVSTWHNSNLLQMTFSNFVAAQRNFLHWISMKKGISKFVVCCNHCWCFNGQKKFLTLSMPVLACRLLLAFSNSLDPDQDQQKVFLKYFFQKDNFENSHQTTTIAWKITKHAKS